MGNSLNLLDFSNSSGGFLLSEHFSIMDRDKKCGDKFRRLIIDSGTKAVRLPAKWPNLNDYCERFILSIKQKCLDRMFFFSEKSLRQSISDYVIHSHRERNHQSLDNKLRNSQDIVGKRTD